MVGGGEAGATADLFHDGIAGIGGPDPGAAPSAEVYTSDTFGEPASIINSATSAPIVTELLAAPAPPAPITEATLDVPSSASQSAAPILEWSGDLGTGILVRPVPAVRAAERARAGPALLTRLALPGRRLVIDIVWDSSVASAPAGFVTAVDQVVSYYESASAIRSPSPSTSAMAKYQGQPLQSDALGESETALTSVSYSKLQSALAANADAIGDTAAAASLPATSPVSGGEYWMATAEADALGNHKRATTSRGLCRIQQLVIFCL